MNPSMKLDFDVNGKKMDVTFYRGMIESLLYLTASRPGIVLSVSMCKISSRT